MSCPSGGYSPSGEKPVAVYADWLAQNLIEPMAFESVSHADLCLAHSTDYVEGVFSGKTNNGHGNKNLDVAESTRWTVGSLVAAAREAVRSRVACSPSSGFHHAYYGAGGGFCTFNDPLGGLLTNEELSKRDSTVFERCCNDKIPIAWNLAGGYQKTADGSIHKVIEIHRETMRQCNRVFDQAS